MIGVMVCRIGKAMKLSSGGLPMAQVSFSDYLDGLAWFLQCLQWAVEHACR